MNDKSSPRVAFSYLRYSDARQGDGDSLRRQTEAARRWCEQNGVTLDTGTYCDPGVSAFRGKHRETGVLAAFLRDVEAERIPRGSILLIENMDRLSRESPVRGVHLLSGLLIAGIHVVTLAPEVLELTDESDLFSLFRGQMSQARGHDESKTKSVRVTEAWDNRKRLARAGQGIVTRKLPAWVKEKNGKLVPIPERVAIIRRMFDMAVKGRGLSLITREFVADDVKPWGRAQCWGRAYVHKVLRSRAVLGEYQPMKDGKPDGDAIPDYYPKIIDVKTWDRVQDLLLSRQKQPGRVGKRVANLFTGLLWDARTRGKMLIAWQGRGRPPKRERYRVLASARATEAGTGVQSFPNDIFEPALLNHMKEIDPADITGEVPESKSATLAAEVAALDERMKAVEAEMIGDGGDVPALARVLKGLDTRRQEKLKELTAARRAEDNPLAGTWAEARSLIGVAKDEAGRLRLRSLLQTAIAEVWVLIVRTPGQVACVAQTHFRSGIVRDVLIVYLPATRGRAMTWHALSFAAAGLPPIDLRKPADVAKVEKLLTRLKLDNPTDAAPSGRVE